MKPKTILAQAIVLSSKASADKGAGGTLDGAGSLASLDWGISGSVETGLIAESSGWDTDRVAGAGLLVGVGLMETVGTGPAETIGTEGLSSWDIGRLANT